MSHVVNPASGAGANYQIPIQVDYNYMAYYNLSTQWVTVSGNLSDRHNFEPVHKTNILEVDKVVDGSTWKYVAYDCNSEGTQIRLYYTNNLNGSWTPYSGNPILSSSNAVYCWPDVVYNGSTFFMFVENNVAGGIQIYTSTNGITYTLLENVVVPTTTIYMDTFCWFNPKDNRWFLYYCVWNSNASEHALLVRNSTTILGLANATDETVLTGGGYGAPTVMYGGGYYWLLVESGENGTGWIIQAFWSSSPTSNFLETQNSPILTGNEACPVSLLSPNGTTAYLFTTHLTGGTWYEETRQIYSTRPMSPSNNDEVSLNALCRPDLGDVRFTGSDGSTLLSYWMESEVNSNYALFWVKIADNLNSSSTTMYIYFGNSGATTTSSGTATFLLFDDFLGSSLNATKWSTYGSGSVSVSNGVATLSANSGGQLFGIASSSTFGLNTRVIARAESNITGTDADSEVGYRNSARTNVIQACRETYSTYPDFYLETTVSGASRDVNTNLAWNNNWQVFYVMRTSSSSVTMYVGSSSVSATSTTDIPSGSLSAYAGSWNGGTLAKTYLDWIAVTKYVSPEPAQGGWGSVQTSSVSVNISPSSVALDLGQSRVFTSNASGGTAPYAYQWYLNGTLQGTGSTWTFTPTSSGFYTVYVNATDANGNRAKSNVASATAYSALSVSISPSSMSLDYNNPSQSQVFTATASGGLLPYVYQWYLNGILISGATAGTYVFTPVSSEAGLNSLHVNVTDTNNFRAKSNTATITVSSAPSVSISPSSATLDVGQTVSFASGVSGGVSPFVYQWFLNGVQVGTSSSYAFTPPSANSYTLYLNVTDQNNYRTKSNNATVTVHTPPKVSISPSSVTINVGRSKTFNSTISGGTSPYSYQWYLNGTIAPSGASSSWVFTPSSPGSYNVYLNVTDNVGFRVMSNTATVTVNPAPLVSILPTSATIDIGESQVFTSTVSGGTSPFSYQWYLNGAAASGATGLSWIFTPSSSGSYSIYLNVTDNTQTWAVSGNSSINVNRQLTVTVSPTSATIYNGQSQIFTSNAKNGTSPYTYQWYVGGAAINGATSSSWTCTPSSTGTYQIYVIVTDFVGQAVQSSSATLVVNAPPPMTVTVSPSAVTLGLGQSQTFVSSVSGGTPSYTYQWYLDGNPIIGATTSAYTCTPSSVGSHQLTLNVTDSLNVKNSFTVTMNVWSSPFSVVSNSTVSGLVFNSTSDVLSFIVSGPSGTHGYTNVTIARTLITNASALAVYFDGNKINFTLASTNYYWLLHFTYHHSTHQIVIYMNTPQPKAASEIQYGSFTITVGIIIATIAIVTVIMNAIINRKQRKHNCR